MANKKNILFLLFIFCLVLFTIYYYNPTLLWDENAYLANARSHSSHSYYAESFRFPLLEYIIAAAWLLTKESIFIARLIIMLFSIGSVYVFYLISRGHVKYPILPTIIFAFSPLTLFWSFRVYTDMPSLFFILLSYYFIQHKKIYLAGIVGGLSFLTRFTAVIFLGSVIMYYFLNKNFKSIAKFGTGCLIIISPWALYNHFVHGNLFWDVVTTKKLIDQFALTTSVSDQIWKFVSVMQVWILMLPLGIYSALKNTSRYLFLAGIYLIFGLLVIFSIHSNGFSRYFLIYLPFLFLLSYIGLKKATKKYWRIFYTGFLIFTLVVSSHSVYRMVNQGKCLQQGALEKSLLYLKEKVREGNVVISNAWPWYGYHLNLRVSSLWTKDIEVLIKKYNPKYLVLIKRYDYDEQNIAKRAYLHLEKSIQGKCGDEVRIYTAAPNERFQEVLKYAGINKSFYTKMLRQQLSWSNLSNFAKGDIILTLGRITDNYTLICNAIDYYEHYQPKTREEEAITYESIASLICDKNDTMYLLKAADIWDELGVPFRGKILRNLAQGRKSRLVADLNSISRTVVVPNADNMIIGNSSIVLTKEDTLVSQAERVSRDWLSAQIHSPLNPKTLRVFSERFTYNESELYRDIGWHEGGRISELKQIGLTQTIATGTLAYKVKGKWYAPNEEGVFMFEIPEDKIWYPTTRFFRDDLAMIVDTHGINMLVEQAIRKNATVVVGCCDHPGKINAVRYLSNKGIKSICFTDRFLPNVLGEEISAIGSPPIRHEQNQIILGNRPIVLNRGEKIMVMNATASPYGLMYYDTPARYFEKIPFLNITFFTIHDFNQMHELINMSKKINATAIAVRVFNKDDYVQVRAWLKQDKKHRAILFHSIPYPYGYKLFEEFPEQTTFDDINPIFKKKSIK